MKTEYTPHAAMQQHLPEKPPARHQSFRQVHLPQQTLLQAGRGIEDFKRNGLPRVQELHRASRSLYSISEVKTNPPLSTDTVLNRADLPLWQVFASPPHGPPQSNLQLPDDKSSASDR